MYSFEKNVFLFSSVIHIWKHYVVKLSALTSWSFDLLTDFDVYNMGGCIGQQHVKNSINPVYHLNFTAISCRY
jgi:hypothetical protein